MVNQYIILLLAVNQLIQIMCLIIHADGSPLDTTDCLLDSEYVLRQSIVIVAFYIGKGC